MENQEMTFKQKMAKIRAGCDAAKRDKEGYGYTYSDITEILIGVKKGMNKYGISLTPMIVPGTSRVVQNVVENIKYDRAGNKQETRSTEMLYTADMVYRWADDANPEEFEDVSFFAAGAQSDPSQAVGTALSYSLRQFLTDYFQIAQTQIDVDAYRSKQKKAAAEEDRVIAEEIIATFDKKFRIYLADHQEQKEELIKFLSRYEKSANYLAIKEPALASKLLEDFTNTYLSKEET